MIGQTIAERYLIEAVVGRGGMGTVYRATDLVEDRPVALKALHITFDDADTALTRFHREFRVLARLDHPRIVRAFDCGIHQNVPYLTLEFLAGQTLKDKLTGGPLPYSDRLAIARELDLREQLAFMLNDLQGSYFATAQLDRAQAALAEAQELWRELGNMPMLADNLVSTATNDYLSGEYEQALALAEEALQISQSIENLWGLAHSRWLLGHIYFEYGHPDQAIEALEETVRLGEAGGFVPMTTRSDLGWIYGGLGAIERGLKQIHLSLAETESLLPEWRSYPLVMQAWVHLGGGDLAAAEADPVCSQPG